jgi:hypothetical protein
MSGPYTACDIGTYVPDMDVVARETRYVTGRNVKHGPRDPVGNRPQREARPARPGM